MGFQAGRGRRRPLRMALTGLGSAMVALFVVAAVSAQGLSWNHNPDDAALGPSGWGTIDPSFETCLTGESQTPVDIAAGAPTTGAQLQFSYPDNPLVVENNGHVIEVPIPAGNGNTLRVGSNTYSLLQFHFHAPSEHTLNGRSFPMELHLVHRNTAGELAVVGVFLEVGPGSRPLFDDIFTNAPDVAGEEHETHAEMNAKSILPALASAAVQSPAVQMPGVGGADQLGMIGRYNAYSGSLTTPPCSEGVSWYVLKDTVRISQTAVDRMHELVAEFPGYEGFPDNNRPVQPLNGRTITNVEN